MRLNIGFTRTGNLYNHLKLLIYESTKFLCGEFYATYYFV